MSSNYTEGDFDPTNMEVCLNHNEYVQPGSIDHRYCDKPMVGRYLAFVIPRSQYLTICELMVFGVRGKRK